MRCVRVLWCWRVHVRVGEGGVCVGSCSCLLFFFLHFWIFVFGDFFVLVYIFEALVLIFSVLVFSF